MAVSYCRGSWGLRWAFSRTQVCLEVLWDSLNDLGRVQLVKDFGLGLRLDYTIKSRASDLIRHIRLLRVHSDAVLQNHRWWFRAYRRLRQMLTLIHLILIQNRRQLMLLTNCLLLLLPSIIILTVLIILLLISFRLWKRFFMLWFFRWIIDCYVQVYIDVHIWDEYVAIVSGFSMGCLDHRWLFRRDLLNGRSIWKNVANRGRRWWQSFLG